MNDGGKGGNGQAAAPGGARPAVLSLSIKEKAALYAAYMPYLKAGGMFVPTTRPYQLGDDFTILTCRRSYANSRAGKGLDQPRGRL